MEVSTVIELDELSCGYSRQTVVSGVSLTFEQGKLYSLIGRNGCGKSTLLMTAAGLIKPMSGDVRVEGVSVFSMKPRELAKKSRFFRSLP